jgi:hypothetical protein
MQFFSIWMRRHSLRSNYLRYTTLREQNYQFIHCRSRSVPKERQIQSCDKILKLLNIHVPQGVLNKLFNFEFERSEGQS